MSDYFLTQTFLQHYDENCKAVALARKPIDDKGFLHASQEEIEAYLNALHRLAFYLNSLK